MLRPANILFDARGGIKVADFGLPLLLEAATEEAIVTGVQYISMDYIAPEQISGKSVSPATDVYSLAAVIYTLLTGQAPFDAKDPRSLLEQQLIKSAPSVGPLASPEFEATLRRAMDFAPDRRPSNLEAFAAELGIAIDTAKVENPTAKLTPVDGPPAAASKQRAPRKLRARGHAPKIRIGDKFARLTIRDRIAFTPITTVFRASDKSDVRQAALKILSPEFEELPKFADYFRSIVRRFAAFKHANLIPILGGGHSHNYLYYAVPFLSGGNLADRLESGPIDPDDALNILREIAPAISYLHQEGIVHQSIKPSNIHFDEEGNAHLAEVGLGQMMYAAASTFVDPKKLGPIGYRSPEQLSGRRKGSKLDGRSDIYSLGVLLFEMLTGRPPFEAETAADLAMLQFSSPVPSPRQVRPVDLQPLDRQLDEVLRIALSYSPRGRFNSVSELMSAVTGVFPLDLPDSDVIAFPAVAPEIVTEGLPADIHETPTIELPPLDTADLLDIDLPEQDMPVAEVAENLLQIDTLELLRPSTPAVATAPAVSIPVPIPVPEKRPRVGLYITGALGIVGVIVIGAVLVFAGGRARARQRVQRTEAAIAVEIDQVDEAVGDQSGSSNTESTPISISNDQNSGGISSEDQDGDDSADSSSEAGVQATEPQATVEATATQEQAATDEDVSTEAGLASSTVEALATDEVEATEAPTISPTETTEPTAEPTAAPTETETPAPTVAPTLGPAPGEDPENAAAELAIISLTNQNRSNQGVAPPVGGETSMMSVAQERSDDMDIRNYFSHNDPVTGSVPAFELLSGYGAVGENLFITSGSIPIEELAERAMSSWMSSPGHRANILDSVYEYIGVGIRFDDSCPTYGDCWLITQVFASEIP